VRRGIEEIRQAAFWWAVQAIKLYLVITLSLGKLSGAVVSVCAV